MTALDTPRPSHAAPGARRGPAHSRTQSRRLPRSAGVAAALVTTTAWGGQFIVGKSAMAHLDPVWMTALRYGAASLVFLGLLAAAEGPEALRPSRDWPRAAVLGTVGFAGFNLLAFFGLTRTTPEAASLIVSTMPLITAFVLWGRTRVAPGAVTWLSSVVALLGIGLVLSEGHPEALVHGVNSGDLLVLAGAASWVVYTTGASTLPGWSPLRYTALSSAAGAVAIFAVALTGTALGRLDLPSASAIAASGWQLAYMVVLAAVVAVLCWNVAMQVLGPQTGVLFINVVPITTFAVQAVLGRAPHAAQVAGVGLTVLALIGNSLGARRAAR